MAFGTAATAALGKSAAQTEAFIGEAGVTTFAAFPVFSPELEQAFYANYYQRVRLALRIVTGLLAGLSLAYAGRDYLDTQSAFLAVRVNGAPAALYLLLHTLTYSRGFGRVWMPVTTLGGIAAAALSLSGLALFIAHSPPETAAHGASFFTGRSLFFTLQTCILLICFTAFRLPFRWAFTLQTSVLATGLWAFASWLMPQNHHAAQSTDRFLQPTLLVLFVVVLTAFVQERMARGVFWASHKIKEDAQEIAFANERLRKDMDAAARIQRALLPSRFPDTTVVRFTTAFHPCDALGGDIFNVFTLDEQHIGFYLLDVVGHGLAAALMSVAVSHFLMPTGSASFLFAGDANARIAAPRDVVTRLNAHFSRENSSQYFTLFYGILNTKTLELRYVNAGHPPPLILSPYSGLPVWLEGKGGLPVGVWDEADYTETSLQLEPDSRFYLYSDGVTEARGPDRELFGEARLACALAHLADTPLDKVMEPFRARLRDWMGGHDTADDDISLVAFEVVGVGIPRQSAEPIAITTAAGVKGNPFDGTD